MLKASNNHFGDRSKIKLPKIREFCNLKSAKIAKKLGKIFSAPILEHTTCIKHFKNYTKWKRRSNTFNSHIFLWFLRMPHSSKFMPNKVFLPFYPIFAPIKLKKGLIFYILKQDLSSICFLIHLTYLFFILIKNITRLNSNLVLKCLK